MKHTILALTLLTAVSVNAEETNTTASQPMTNATETYGVLGGGYAFGGDTLANASFTDGDSDSVKAGQGLWFDFGFKTYFNNWAIKGTIGYKFDSITASNGDITFSRIPLTLTGQYLNGDHSFGAGFTYELNPNLDFDIPGDNSSFDFDNEIGLVFEYEKNQGEWSWGARYTLIDYTPEGISGLNVDGNNLGIFANWYF